MKKCFVLAMSLALCSTTAFANVKAAITAIESVVPAGAHEYRNGCRVTAVYDSEEGHDGKMHPWTNVVVVPAGQATGIVFALGDSDHENDALTLTSSSRVLSVSTHYVAHGSDAGHREQATVRYSLVVDKKSKVITATMNGQSASCQMN